MGTKFLLRIEKGLNLFVMSLNHSLATLSYEDVDSYIISHNEVDLSRKEELLRTNIVRGFKVPKLPIYALYRFANSIIAIRIFWRDKGCIVCKSIYPLHLHHKKGYFNLKEETLTTLCRRCHLLIRHAALQYSASGES